MDDVRGDFIEPSHGTTPAAVIAIKNIKVSSLESNVNTQRQSVGHIAQFHIMNPRHKLAMNARRLYCKFS